MTIIDQQIELFRKQFCWDEFVSEGKTKKSLYTNRDQTEAIEAFLKESMGLAYKHNIEILKELRRDIVVASIHKYGMSEHGKKEIDSKIQKALAALHEKSGTNIDVASKESHVSTKGMGADDIIYDDTDELLLDAHEYDVELPKDEKGAESK